MLNLINAMAAEGSRVDLVLNATDIPELASIHHDVQVFPIGKGSLFQRSGTLANYLDSQNPGVLLTNHRERANRDAVIAKRRSEWPGRLVFRIGNTLTEMLRNRGVLKKLLLTLSVRYCYEKADLIVANSRGVADDVLKVTGVSEQKLRVIGNSTINEEIFIKANEPCAHPWFKKGQPPVIIGLGRLVRQKGFSDLLKAFAKARSRMACRLIIIGSGKEKDSLNKLAKELGVVEDFELAGYEVNPFRYLRRSHLFVLSSQWEGLPNALIEALALGVPVVSTDCHSGPREILHHGKYGPLVPVGDVDALAAAILEVLENPPQPELLKEAAIPYHAKLSAQFYLDELFAPVSGSD